MECAKYVQQKITEMILFLDKQKFIYINVLNGIVLKLQGVFKILNDEVLEDIFWQKN